jgi:hypothetical protein
MDLAKPRLDIGLATNDLAPTLAFWQGEAGIPFDHLLPIRKGQDQHRHDVLGSVLKINHHADPLPDTPPSGYLELIVARAGLTAPVAMTDPGGARVSLVPPGHEGVTQIGVRIGFATWRRTAGSTPRPSVFRRSGRGCSGPARAC